MKRNFSNDGVMKLNFWIRHMKDKNTFAVVGHSRFQRGWLNRFSSEFKKELKKVMSNK